jgi:hypothetical protein
VQQSYIAIIGLRYDLREGSPDRKPYGKRANNHKTDDFDRRASMRTIVDRDQYENTEYIRVLCIARPRSPRNYGTEEDAIHRYGTVRIQMDVQTFAACDTASWDHCAPCS